MRTGISIMLVSWLLMGAVVSTAMAAQGNIPNAVLYVTVQQKEQEKISRGYHIYTLICGEGVCELTTVSLGQCGTKPNG